MPSKVQLVSISSLTRSSLPARWYASSVLLRLPDRPDRLQQRVEPSGGGRGLGEQEVETVELDHVGDPRRVHDGLAARDRKRMEHAGRPVAVALQRVEERRRVALRD